MKRLPLIASFILFIALCASSAYWALQLFKPPERAVAAPPQAASGPSVPPDAAASLFGARQAAVVSSNYQLTGVVAANIPSESAAIISIGGKPAKAYRVNAEIAPGVTLKEVQHDHVLISEGGAAKRVELPKDAKRNQSVSLGSPQLPMPPGIPQLR